MSTSEADEGAETRTSEMERTSIAGGGEIAMACDRSPSQRRGTYDVECAAAVSS